ncbi:MAG: hypothetical protein IT353_08745 [Gemmatimonadaceae bacterium]|nr:hypothetical protein [Gemmatimonadaceae bacterium]
MGGSLGSIKTSLASATKGLNVSPIMQAAMGMIADSGDQRAAFNAILLATSATVANKPNFNLELEINDLWIRLGNLRNMAPAGGGLPKAASPLSSIGPALESVMQAMAKQVDAAQTARGAAAIMKGLKK